MARLGFGLFFAFLGFALGLMMQVGPHDAATNLCNWSPFPDFCRGLLPSWFDQWAWLLPTSLLCAAIILFFWAPIEALFKVIARRRKLIPLSEAAAIIYGELRGTDLGRFTEGLTESPDEILDSVGMQILHNATVLVRRHPSPIWEVFPKSEIGKMGVCQGATGIRYWGKDQIIFTDPKVSRREVARVAKSLKQNANYTSEWSRPPPEKSGNGAVCLAYGEDGPFERLINASMSRLERMLLIEFMNPFPDKDITGCKLEITSIEPFMGVRRPFVLRDNFSLAGGDHVFIPFVTYGESRTVDRAMIADTAIAVCAPEGANPHFLAALPHDVENIITIRATAMGAAYCEEKVVVWVGAGTRLRIRKYEQGEDVSFLPLEDATKEAYGAARRTDIGEAAEKMNSSGVLSWFAYYYHTKGIPVFGNVRNSTRVEPVLFRYLDVQMENDRLIGREIHGDLVWENMKVRKSDHGRLLGMLRDHARALQDG